MKKSSDKSDRCVAVFIDSGSHAVNGIPNFVEATTLRQIVAAYAVDRRKVLMEVARPSPNQPAIIVQNPEPAPSQIFLTPLGR
jgi:hypothetical protein